MSTTIIPNCYHADGTPCVSYTIDAEGGSYHYLAPPGTTVIVPPPVTHATPPVTHGVPEPGGWLILAAGVLAVLSMRGRRAGN